MGVISGSYQGSITVQINLRCCFKLYSDFIFIVYQMGRLCGGAHEISGIKAPPFSVGGGDGVGVGLHLQW